MAALLALPAAASADARLGRATDPAGDGLGAPSQDIVGASVFYDVAGDLYATATMGGVVGATPRTLFRFSVATFTPPDQCGGTGGALLLGYSDAAYTTASPGYGAPIERQGASITLNGYGSTLRGRAFSCMTLTVSDPAGKVLDTLDVPLYFDGFGPDSDGDGVADNADRCPAQVGVAPHGCEGDSDGDTIVDSADQCPGLFGVAPTGCPAAAPLPGPPGIVTTLPADPAPKPACSPVKLKGKSLAAARQALGKAGCRLGKVTKPRKVKHGAKLVVVKQTGRNPVAITLAAAKRK